VFRFASNTACCIIWCRAIHSSAGGFFFTLRAFFNFALDCLGAFLFLLFVFFLCLFFWFLCLFLFFLFVFFFVLVVVLLFCLSALLALIRYSRVPRLHLARTQAELAKRVRAFASYYVASSTSEGCDRLPHCVEALPNNDVRE
jgi:hypothetical protein